MKVLQSQCQFGAAFLEPVFTAGGCRVGEDVFFQTGRSFAACGNPDGLQGKPMRYGGNFVAFRCESLRWVPFGDFMQGPATPDKTRERTPPGGKRSCEKGLAKIIALQYNKLDGCTPISKSDRHTE